MEHIISTSNIQFVERAIRYMTLKLQIDRPEDMLWVIYGSYVINMNKSGSDLDMLVIHKSDTPIVKITDVFENVPVHFMSINQEVLQEDGQKRLYGAYMTGKIINPHIFVYGDASLRNEALLHSGQCIGPLAGYLSTLSKHPTLSASAITALVFIAYLSTDPSFDSYFLNYYQAPTFHHVWKALTDATTEMLLAAHEIAQHENAFIFTQPLMDYQSFHRERMKISARHWSYGAVCHGSDRTFQDQIFSKAERKMNENDPHGITYKEMVKFLRHESGLLEIYI